MAASIAVINENDGFIADFGSLEWPVAKGLTNSSHPWKVVQRDRSKTITFTPERVTKTLPTQQDGDNNGAPGSSTQLEFEIAPIVTTTKTLDPNLVTFLDITFSDDRSATITLYPRTELDKTVTVTTTVLTDTSNPQSTGSGDSSELLSNAKGVEDSSSSVPGHLTSNRSPNIGLIAATAVLGALFLISFVTALLLRRKVRRLEREDGSETISDRVREPAARGKYVYAGASEASGSRRTVLERVELPAEEDSNRSV